MSEQLERKDGAEIELLDLGDVTIETKQYSIWPIWYDSAFLLGEKQP